MSHHQKKTATAEETKSEDYEVSRIIDTKVVKNRRFYLVRWKNYSADNDTWEPEEHLNCPELIEAFQKKLNDVKNVSEKQLRVKRTLTDRFTIPMYEKERRLSKRTAGKRVNYNEE